MAWIMRRWDRKSVHRSSFSVTLAFILSVFVIPVTAQPGQGGVPVYPQNQTVLNGTSVTFVCTIPGADSVAWMDEKSTPVVADGQRVSVSVSGLTIDPVDYRQDQHGFYCVGVFNGERNVTTKSPVAYLNVHYMEYNFQPDLPEIVNIYVGDDSVFTCSPPEANPPVSEWTWHKGFLCNTRLQSVSGKFTVNNSQLTVHNATTEDDGYYCCTAGNGDFNRTSMSHLTVKSTVPIVNAMVAILGVDPVPAQLFAVVRSNYTVECKVRVVAKPPRAIDNTENEIVWRKGGEKVRNNSKTEVFENGSLALYNFDSTLVGDYRCSITLKYSGEAMDEEDAVVKVELATIGEDIAIDPSTVTRGRGNHVEFTCKLPSSKPQPSVRWMRNSTTIVNLSTHSEILLFEDSSKLVLSDLKLEDAGTYTCEVMNIAGTRSATVNLTVQDFPDVTVVEEVTYVKEGRSCNLSCQSSSANASSYRWYFGQKPINLTNSAKYSVLTPSGKVLQIVNITENEIGVYTCEVTEDSIHEPRNATGFVRFTHELYIQSEPNPKSEAVTGENVSLVCEFRAHYANSDTNRLKLQWFHDNPEVTNSTRHTIYTVSPPGRSELFIRNVSHVDDGNYTCKAMLNGTDEDVNRVIALSVITKAYFIKKPLPTVTVYLGENRSIECVGGGKPQPRTVWRKLGQSGGELKDSSKGLLNLSNIKESDGGVYECVVIGDRNTVRANTTVIVSTKEPPPNVPTETIIVIGIALVALVFYLLVAVLILCACAQCCRSQLRKKHKELQQMEAEVRRSSRKSQDVKDNSAILRQTPGFSSPGAVATTSFAIPASPSPSSSRRAMTVVSVDAPTVNSITTPLHSLPTTITEPVQLPNFSRRNLKLGDRLGEGEFGPVLLGTAYGLSPENGPMLVAVKVWMHPRDEDEESADYDLMNFYSQMRLRFDNIASIVGMCTDVEPYYIIYEYLERGDLKQFLQDCRPDEIGTPILTQENLLHIVKQVANGMAYLASQRIIHGDLAARSCIVSTDLRVKVADLGIGHDVYREDYYDNGEQLLPVRWMPPEILQTAEFTLHSDMWSFGVFCWEVFAFGRLPYEDVTDEEVLRLVPQGLRLEVPEEGCPISLYSIMRECWNPHPEARPKFSRLVVAIIDLNLD